MTLTQSLSQRVNSGFQTARDIRRMVRLPYSTSERASLISALRCHGDQTDLLNFHVSFLNGATFRWTLREIFFHGDYVFTAETDSPTILDCGANIGLATLFFKRIYPKARISCFEADPTTAAVLKKNIDQNHLQNVTVHNLMLCSADGERSFYIAGNLSGSGGGSGTPGRLSDTREIRVKAGKLSDYIDGPIDLLKLDVEGAEFDVMADMKVSGCLSQIKRMVIEYHHKIAGQTSNMAKFLAFLEDAGFEYQIAAYCDPISQTDIFQDILIGAYRPAQINSRI
jgi:FkbM family methyltransferase